MAGIAAVEVSWLVAPGDDAIVRQAKIRAPLEQVYQLWVDPEQILRWQGVSAELDPRPGGIYRVNVTGSDITRGEFKEVEPNARLVFTWGFEAPGHPVPAGSTTVEVTFTHQNEITTVRVSQRGVAGGEQQTVAFGWQHYLTRLGMVAVGRDPGPDPWVSVKLVPPGD